jgi:hypothetical protein
MRPFRLLFVFASALLAQSAAAQLVQSHVLISVRDQKLVLIQDGLRVATYPVSTSKFGLGDNWGAMTTPTGTLQVAQKIGDHAPVGAVFHKRRFTGEILAPNAPGRDPIITRIIWLRGLEAENARAFNRCIYIHGTPQEKLIGRPVSYGCIRMKSADVTALYVQIPIGALVRIIPDRLPRVSRASRAVIAAAQAAALAPPQPPLGLDVSDRNAAKTALAPKTAPTTRTKKIEATAWVRNARA